MKLEYDKAITIVSESEEIATAVVPIRKTSTDQCVDFCKAIEDGFTEGFKQGSVVVQRRDNPLSRMNPINWGIIVALNRWTSGPITFEPKPLVVRWADGTKQEHYKEDLYVINNVPSYEELRARVEYNLNII